MKSRPLDSYRDGDELFESLLAPDGSVDPAKVRDLKDQFHREHGHCPQEINALIEEATAALAPGPAG